MSLFADIEFYALILGAVVIVIAVLCYIYYLRSRLDTMEQILNCIKCNNYAVRPPSRWTGPFRDDRGETINNVLNYLNERYQLQQEQLLYLNNMLDNVDSALIVVDDAGCVNWCNRAAQRTLLGFLPTTLRQLESLAPDLPAQLAAIRPGEVKTLRFERDGNLFEMAATVTHYQSRRKQLAIYNLHNIHQLLMENEQQANRQLMRVLTHEMMNSLTPIIALSDTLKSVVSQPGCDWQEVADGISVIRRRSDGLLRFVNNYRKLSKLNPPTLLPLSPYRLLDSLRLLTCGFRSEVVFPPAPANMDDPLLQIDRVQMEQVLLNLLKNADEACREVAAPRIEIGVELSEKQVQIHVRDNGMGISPAALERIFIPFYTTKQQGSGIGLALCRQIMLNHRGSISVQSTPGQGACFTLHFPKSI